MNRFGVSEADAEAWALSEFADYDAAEHSVAATVRSCYALTAEHATCRLARYARARTSKDKSGGGGSRAPPRATRVRVPLKISRAAVAAVRPACP